MMMMIMMYSAVAAVSSFDCAGEKCCHVCLWVSALALSPYSLSARGGRRGLSHALVTSISNEFHRYVA